MPVLLKVRTLCGNTRRYTVAEYLIDFVILKKLTLSVRCWLISLLEIKLRHFGIKHFSVYGAEK